MEIRKDIVWYEWLYMVSNLWNIKSLNFNKSWFEKLLLCSPDKDWYLRVTLCNNKWHKVIKIHKLVAIAFIKNNNNKPQINHIDWDRKNNEKNNLERCTSKENINHL